MNIVLVCLHNMSMIKLEKTYYKLLGLRYGLHEVNTRLKNCLLRRINCIRLCVDKYFFSKIIHYTTKRIISQRNTVGLSLNCTVISFNMAIVC